MGSTVIVFTGEYDLAYKDQLRKQLLGVHLEPSLVLDLSEATYIDSSFVTELVKLHHARDAHGFGPETIVLRHPMLQRLFDILDLNTTFRIVRTLDDAIATDGEMSVRYAFNGDAGEACEVARLPYQEAG